MDILIVGAGQVGTDIAKSLSENHKITVIDEDPERVEEVNYNVDALTVEGDGTSLGTLEQAGIEGADTVMAATDDDRTNLVVCGTAKAVGEAFTIARVKKKKYLEAWKRKKGALGVDHMVASDLLTAEKVVRILTTPSAHDVDVFSEGTVQMAEFEVGEESPVSGQTVQEADRFASLTFAAILRNGETVVPGGGTFIEGGDRVVVIGSPENVHGFAVNIAPEHTPGENDDIVVFGGSEIGYDVATILSERGLEPRLVEQDSEKARELAEELPGAVVMENDATERDFLERERIGEADIVVSALGLDEKNLLSALLAKKMGADRTIAVVEDNKYVELFEAVGVDVAVNPREVVAEEITRLTQKNRTEGFALVGGEQAEVIEINVDEKSILAGRTIRESDAELPSGVVIGAISREMEFVPPRGDTTVEVGDNVVLFVESEVSDEVADKL